MICELCCGVVVIGITALVLLTIQYPREPDNIQHEATFVDGSKEIWTYFFSSIF